MRVLLLVGLVGCGGSGGGSDPGADASAPEVDGSAGDGDDAAVGDATAACAQPDGVPSVTLNEIWQADPETATEYWIPGMFVTAVTGNGCSDGTECSIYLQQAESFEDLADGSQQALRLSVSADAAGGFSGIAPHDEIDVHASAWRVPPPDANDELILEVTAAQPGCANVVGSGELVPVEVVLDDLMPDDYLTTVGPLLVSVLMVTGNPDAPGEPFGLWPTGTAPDDSIETVKSLSPSCLDGGTFTGLTDGQNTDFTSVTGTFATLWDDPIMHLQICVRETSDYPH